MDALKQFVDLFLHLDKHLSALIAQYGTGTYAILFLIVFCETGLVVMPLLPGDSLLFAAGAFCATGALDPFLLCVLLFIAAVAGDALNYYIGAKAGPKVFREGSRWFKKEHLDRTHEFYERYGGKTIIFARFMPIIRTFAPFVAGVGRMSYPRFLMFNLAGGAAWVLLFVLGGYFFGNLPAVKHNFTLVIMAIIVLSVLPGVVEYMRSRRA
jgi:membrane-associated protein